MKNNSRATLVGILLLAVVSLTLPIWAEKFTIQLATKGLYLGLLAMSFILLAGYGDMVSLAQMSFALMAGYVIGIGNKDLGIDHLTLVPLAILATVFLAMVFGLVAIRAYGIYFLVMTLALSQLFFGVGMQWVSVTHGYPGIPGIERPVIFGHSLVEAEPLYYVTLIVTAISYVILWRLVRSPFGLVLQGIRDNPKRMASLGFNVQRHRYVAIVISGAFAGVGGILVTYFTGVAAPSRANLPSSILVVIAALVGGVSVLEGGLLGGLIIAFLTSIASQATTRYWTVLGTVFVLIVIFMPNGLLGIDSPFHVRLRNLWRRIISRWQSTKAPEKPRV